MSNTEYVGQAKMPDAWGDFNAMKFIAQQVMNGMATITVIEVMAVDSAKKTVDARPMVHQIDGAANSTPHETIHGLPYFGYRAGANAFVLTPEVGDKGLAVFCHNDISSVKANKKASLPGSRRRYDWSDGVYIGGLPGLFQSDPTQTIEMNSDGITITTTNALTINATGGVAITGDVDITGKLSVSDESTLDGKAFSSHRHSGVTTGGGNSGPPL
jgi:hypothetical protein